MPIVSIISQPATNSINAAYRPVIFQVRASRTDNNARPPVVYCDMYFNGIYYKTISKTQYKALNATDSDWQFDIQDACQEILNKVIADNGSSVIVRADELRATVLCKFRSSGFDTNGFITAEDTAPIQGTGRTVPVSGTGTQSNSFFVVNTTLQHQSNQDLATHLNSFKNGTWQATAFPLSHRASSYKLGPGISDFFPILNLGTKAIGCLRLKYKVKGQTTFSSTTNCGVTSTCVAVGIYGFPSLPNGVAGQPYSYSFTLTGDAPFALTGVTKPGWMTIIITGNTVSFTGTPTTTGVDIAVSFSVTNCSAANTVSFSQTINVIADQPFIFGDSTNITSGGSFKQETENIIGNPGGIVTIKVTAYTNTNSGGHVYANGIEVFLNSTFTVTLDNTGHGSFVSKAQGLLAAPPSSHVSAQFTIDSVTGGSIGTPNSKTISKLF